MERDPAPGTHTHLAFDQLVVPLNLEHVAGPTAHSALGAVVAVTARAVEPSVLHSQLWAVRGLAREVHTAEDRGNKRVRGAFLQDRCAPAGRQRLMGSRSEFQEADTGDMRSGQDSGGAAAKVYHEEHRLWKQTTRDSNPTS